MTDPDDSDTVDIEVLIGRQSGLDCPAGHRFVVSESSGVPIAMRCGRECAEALARDLSASYPHEPFYVSGLQ
ncbi:hypothetical protein [Salinisphaera sp.]|uniref:hypothetical protein n=1 Tax=Salinisphaera sp. TaxID=1914330 RepID=UPI0025E1E0B2|nr:hypothetical protein [Salinisphaera sp.]|tara:strand:+ start:16163 stop:16378 length:216 start_codon:yes stop_codon:yes gene_type:complete